MRIKETKVYKFEELPEEIQEKILDKNRFMNVLKRMRVNVADAPYELLTWKNMYFDLDRGSYIQFTEADFKDDEIARKFLRVPRNIWNRVYWSFENNREWTTKLTYEWEGDNELTKKQEEILDRAVDLFNDKMEEALNHLRKEYEHQCSDEAVKDTILCNEYEFTIDGKFA